MRILYKYFILLCCLSIVLPISAQEIKVKSFRHLPTDITAIIQGTTYQDKFGETASLIRMVTPIQLSYDTGETNILVVKSANHLADKGEIWVWVSSRTRKLNIYGDGTMAPLRGYYLPMELQPGGVYELVLDVPVSKNDDATSQVPTDQYIVMTITPVNAEVLIDGEAVTVAAGGVVSKLLPRGVHSYEVRAAMHKPATGSITITDKKEKMNVTLAPDYGVLQVSSTPSGAEVYIDGAYKSAGTTPFTSEWLSAGNHTLQFKRASYKTLTTDVQVTGDGTTQPFTATLQPNFAEVTITAPVDADIYINDTHKATGTWSVRLDAGRYRVEARKASHRASVQSLEVEAGDNKHITLTAPTPIYGSLNISSSPIGARVFVDGKEIGETPDIFSEVLVGTRTVRLTREGCAPVEQQITIEEGKTATLSLSLATSGKVTISSNVAGAKIYIDDEYKGVAPYTYEAVSGSYRVTAKADGYTDATRNVTITAGQNTNLALAPQPISRNRTFTVKGVSFTMIPVEGGTFTMGATSEQGGDAYDDEKPAHRVTLSDYYIGETEVTQALWKAVMGSNPSSFKGDQRPVESVSWNDCQEFIKKLNALTGRNFRLPTEAEWEYAARGGNKSKGYKYAGSNTIDDVAWYDDNSNDKTHPVKGKQANELGLYDMSGNVWEWCSDWFGDYSSSAQTNPTGPATGSDRVGRGGSWYCNAGICRVSIRNYFTPGNGNYYLGLRLALTK